MYQSGYGMAELSVLRRRGKLPPPPQTSTGTRAPQVPSSSSLLRYAPYAIGAVGVGALALMFLRRKK